MAKLKYDVVAVIGKYKNSDGEEKNRNLKVGVVLESDKGLSMKLDALPVNPEWDGWLRFYEPKAKDAKPAASASAPAAAPSGPIKDDDIPF